MQFRPLITDNCTSPKSELGPLYLQGCRSCLVRKEVRKKNLSKMRFFYGITILLASQLKQQNEIFFHIPIFTDRKLDQRRE